MKVGELGSVSEELEGRCEQQRKSYEAMRGL